MIKSLKYIVVLLVVVSFGFAQLQSDLRTDSSIIANPAQSDNSIGSLFNPNNFSMNHSFSMSMLNMNNQSVGVASYTNNMNFTLRDNLHLQTYLTFMQPKVMSSELANPYANTQMYFNAELDYNPTPNTHLKFSFGNYPQYSRYSSSPFLLNRPY